MADKVNLSGLTTEQRNPATLDIDNHTAAEIVTILNNGDKTVAEAVAKALPGIGRAAEAAAKSIGNGGRLIYMGAGTSGRLGVLDAVECRPTYGIPDGVVVGIIAGGMDAMFRAVEGAEDSLTLGEADLRKIGLTANDTVVGIASSGRTPYVIGALKFAKSVGCTTVSIACSPDAAISSLADIAIEAVTGPEAVTGSTRMKAGSAHKMILNMITTSVMIQLGRVKGNKMVNMQLSNQKLVDRGTRMIVEELGLDYDQAKALLLMHGSVKKAVDAYKAGQ